MSRDMPGPRCQSCNYEFAEIDYAVRVGPVWVCECCVEATLAQFRDDWG